MPKSSSTINRKAKQKDVLINPVTSVEIMKGKDSTKIDSTIIPKKTTEKAILKLLDDDKSKFHEALRSVVDKYINRQFLELQHNHARDDALHSLKEQQLEDGWRLANERLNAIEGNVDRQLSNFRDEIDRIREDAASRISLEREKRLALIKKLNEKVQAKVDDLSSRIERTREESLQSIETLKTMIDTQYLEVNETRINDAARSVKAAM